MKHAPSKLSVRNSTRNQNTGTWHEQEQELRKKAIESTKLFDTLPHLKNGLIKYDVNRKSWKN